MKATVHFTTLVAMSALCATSMVASVSAQNVAGSAAAGLTVVGTNEFRDEKTGKIWTPENVSQDDKAAPAAPTSIQDKAFDPRTQAIVVEGVTVQRPRASLMGLVPITAGPTVPRVELDSASLQAVPGERWRTVLYVTNNSADFVETMIGCLFTNADRKVEDTRAIVRPAAPGERLGLAVYGPPVEMFVDRVTCRVISPI